MFFGFGNIEFISDMFKFRLFNKHYYTRNQYEGTNQFRKC